MLESNLVQPAMMNRTLCLFRYLLLSLCEMVLCYLIVVDRQHDTICLIRKYDSHVPNNMFILSRTR